MSNQAEVARDNASHCESKLHAFRKTQDGIVVAFVLHPNDVPPSLQLAPLGTRYMLALVEIGDDEQPKEVMPNTLGPKCGPETGQHKTTPAPPPDHTARAPLKWEDITPAQQAGIRCNEVPFVKFLGTLSPRVNSTSDAAEFVRAYCSVESRSDIRDGAPLRNWQNLESRYRTWLYAPQSGAA